MDAGVAHFGCSRGGGDFPKGSVSMRTGSSVLQYLRAGRAAGGSEEGGQVTRPASGCQFGNMRRQVGERQQNVRPVKHCHFIVDLGQHIPLWLEKKKSYYHMLRRDVLRWHPKFDDVLVCGGQHSEIKRRYQEKGLT